MPKIKLDKYDRKILEALQKKGRLSNIELAEEIGLSPSPCLRRVRLLEESGVISGYAANLDRNELGLGLTVFVDVKMAHHSDEIAAEFREALLHIPEIIMAYLVSGESDFLLQVTVPDLNAYEILLTRKLLKLPGVNDIRSNFAIKPLKQQATLPLDHLPV